MIERAPSPEVAIITVTYFPGDILEPFIASAYASTTRAAAVFVSDNGSTDGAVETAAERWPQLRVVANGANLGYGTAINRAAATLPESVRWIAVCNPDTRLDPESLDALIGVLESDDAIGAVGPLIVGDDGEAYPSARRLPSLRSGTGHALFTLPWPENPWTRSYHSPGADRGDGTFNSGWLSGSCLVIRRDVYDAIGGFDEDFFMYFEDVDLGRRIRQAGWLNVYAPAVARVVHSGGVTTRRFAARMIDAHHRSAYLYLAKTHPGALLAPVRAVLYLGLRVRSAWLRRSRPH